MKIYAVYRNKVHDVEVTKETKCFYFLQDCILAFGFRNRIEKEDAMLTPQEAIQYALNQRKTFRGGLYDRLIKADQDIEALEQLQNEYGTP